MPARAMQELGRCAFPDPDVAPRDAPIEDAARGSASPRGRKSRRGKSGGSASAPRLPEADRGSGRPVLLS
ncbi:hypothetical protein ACFCYC_00085 [Streptomyces sp. NPDC056402]|uniref:hypothetical protein n=1 Tax=Streptomyces sp. NPDC056402 TaxID=3345810 RepID=UPI0035E0EC52